MLLIPIKACESGSIFEGLLPEGLNIHDSATFQMQQKMVSLMES